MYSNCCLILLHKHTQTRAHTMHYTLSSLSCQKSQSVILNFQSIIDEDNSVKWYDAVRIGDLLVAPPSWPQSTIKYTEVSNLQDS
jgi:hypothetical protein